MNNSFKHRRTSTLKVKRTPKSFIKPTTPHAPTMVARVQIDLLRHEEMCFAWALQEIPISHLNHSREVVMSGLENLTEYMSK